jgi:hypothetical protein
MRKIILFELNEVPLRIVNYFANAQPESALAKMLPKARKFETYTEDKGHLSPWVTWPTLHRGVPNTKHFIQEFGQPLVDVDREFPPIWKILADRAVSVGMFGSLHSYPPPPSYDNYSFYVPDVFASGAECFPKTIEAFQAFNLRMSRESARNVSSRIPFGDTIRLIANFSELGFKARTIGDVARQLVEERVDRWKVIRRRTYQTVIGFDVFYKHLVHTKPDFTTFFTNHVASSLHRYWAAAFPEDYEELGYDQEWLNTFNQEILFTMSKADAMIGRLVQFVDSNPDFELIVATSMGQQATIARPIETQLYITNPAVFMSRMGVDAESWSPRPAMFPQFNVQISDSAAAVFQDNVRGLAVNGEPVEYVHSAGAFYSVSLGQPNLTSIHATLNGVPISLQELGWSNVEILDKSGTTAYHIPQGSLIVYHTSIRPTTDVQQVSTTDLCPYILTNYGVKVPDYMGGRSYSLG